MNSKTENSKKQNIANRKQAIVEITLARRAFISIENGTINKPIAHRALTN